VSSLEPVVATVLYIGISGCVGRPALHGGVSCCCCHQRPLQLSLSSRWHWRLQLSLSPLLSSTLALAALAAAITGTVLRVGIGGLVLAAAIVVVSV